MAFYPTLPMVMTALLKEQGCQSAGPEGRGPDAGQLRGKALYASYFFCQCTVWCEDADSFTLNGEKKSKCSFMFTF